MSWLRQHAIWIAVWLAASALGTIVLSSTQLARLREAFEVDMRIAHRLLSQRVVQHDAVLNTLALLQPPAQAVQPELKLPALYPQILAVHRRERDAAWPDAQERAAETLSRALRRPVLAGLDLARGRYELVLASDPASFVLLMDLQTVVPWNEWPMAPQASPVRVVLEHASQTFVLQPGAARDGGWRFGFSKHLAAESQPFDVVATRQVGWGELPWIWIAAWSLAVAALLAGLRAWQRQREQRRRAEELLRLGQVARLNTLGELAAGMAHELNQPLTAVLANTQAAARLLKDDAPDMVTVRTAMDQASQQARRASEVVGRLRRVVERANPAQPQPMVLQDAVRDALYLLEPEVQRMGIKPRLDAPATPLAVQAEPVALEQIIHNLLMNALQALEQVPPAQRGLHVGVTVEGKQGVLTVADTGAGMAPEVLARVFEPFFTTREKGLGLGLSLCETLAMGMGGRLAAAHHAPQGALFRLTLPLSPP